MSESDDLYQIALLVDQLKHDDSQLRINAYKNVDKIAAALGPERTRDELIPFIADSMDDEDCVLNVIAEKLGELSDYVGGNDQAYVLLKPLESLVCGEESSIRDKGLASAEEILKKLNETLILKHFCPLLNKLANKDWYTARGSAAALAPIAFSKVNDKMKDDILSMLKRLGNDTAPAVRKSVAKSLSSIVKFASNSSLIELTDLYKSLAKDDQDSIRIQIIPASSVFAEYLSFELKSSHIVPTIVNLAGDRSWRVRWSLCHHLKDVFPKFDTNTYPQAGNAVASLAAVYDNLLNDPEPEVRAAGAAHISIISKYVQKTTILNRFLPTAQRLVADNSEFVRAVISGELSQLSPLLGKEDTIKILLPMLLSLLRDDASEVRLNVISRLNGINSTIGVELLSQSLLPSITSLAQDSKWRVRLAVIDLMPMIAEQLGAPIFTDNLLSISISWLSDNIFSIRKAGAANINKLTTLFGSEWATRQILPRLEKMQQQSQYSQRMTSLYSAQVLLDDSNNFEPVLINQLMELVLKLSNDTVANVRLTLAKTLSISLQKPQFLREDIKSEIIKILQRYLDDTDRDVRFYARLALQPAN